MKNRKMKKTSNGITINANMSLNNQICPNKYKNAIDSWAKDETIRHKKSLKKMRKMRKYNMWFGWIMGSLIICWETIQLGDNIINFDGWKSGLLIVLYFFLISLWSWIIYGAFKTKIQIKEDEQKNMLEELEKC